MKIGILTLPLETNYGGILQAYALQKILKENGHEVITIDWHNIRKYSNWINNFKGWIHRNIQYYLKKTEVSISWNPFPTDYHYRVISQNIRKYVERNINLTTSCNPSALKQIDELYNFDAYIVGSDQVWVNSYSTQSFLKFVNRHSVKKITYAASSNDNSWLCHPESVKVIKELSKDFIALSARENNLANSASIELNRDVMTVLDPTFLLKPEDYLTTIQTINSLSSLWKDKNFIFEYILDKNKNNNILVEHVSSQLDLPIERNMPIRKYIRKKHMSLSDYIFPPVDSWIEKINKSKLIITDSFHGTVFAIIFKKPFITIGNNSRGIERFKSLLSTFDLESRLITENTDFKTIDKILSESIDYVNIQNRLNELREKSLRFLLNALNDK